MTRPSCASACLPAQSPPSDTAEEEDESALSGRPSSLPLSLSHSPSRSHLSSEVKFSAVLHIEATATSRLSPILTRSTKAGAATSSKPRQEVDGCFSIMLKSLFMYGVLGVLLIPAKCDPISVCIDADRDLRVDCLIEPKPNKINSYEFSWSSGTKESLINTNVSGSSPEGQFKDKSQVVELEPYGYRMTLSGYTDRLKHNTTYMCKVTGEVARITMESDQPAPCSAVSVFLKSSCPLIVCLLLFFYHTHS